MYWTSMDSPKGQRGESNEAIEVIFWKCNNYGYDSIDSYFAWLCWIYHFAGHVTFKRCDVPDLTSKGWEQNHRGVSV